MIPPYEHPDVIAGQGTLTLEILEEWPEVGALLVPVGGGGLLAGAAAAIVATGAEVDLIAVEPEGAAKVAAALRAGAPVTLERRPASPTGSSRLASGGCRSRCSMTRCARRCR